jgi:predicted NAD/FAD-binding protein
LCITHGVSCPVNANTTITIAMLNRANPHPRKKVAVVGGGCAGIAALWALNRSPHDAYLYEASDRLGGHVNTVEFKRGKFKTIVDTGFIVMNAETYRMFK